ncbi:HGGxSTG domain-containing protein [Burkholderia pseudomallei]|uniref:HGGxSTG domain-containing protein n=1 Tax=Burkholderia pseudomallei TaxID=28450 RepID=UPI001E6197B7|nr:HGGxSTG domain-containing protein [Burkholderia pseudomallei]
MKKCCGAKTRAGTPCKRSPLAGKRRCKLHGGTSTGAGRPARPGNQNARKHGLYSNRLTDDEKELVALMPVGTLDDEIRLARMLLMRTMEAEETDERLMMIDRVILRKPGLDVTYRPPQYLEHIIRLLGRIGRLEVARAELLAVIESGKK